MPELMTDSGSNAVSRIVIVYHRSYGHTRKVAEVVAKASATPRLSPAWASAEPARAGIA